MNKNDFWPEHINASPTVPPDPVREARIERKRLLLACQYKAILQREKVGKQP